jgi:hypothetical protein
MKEVICINAEFTSEQLEIWSRFGVVHPEKDKLYTIRDVIVHSGGEGTGVLLEEIVNPPVPVNNGIIEIMRETTFLISRFRNLQGFPLKKEEIEVKETNYTEI